MKLLRDEAVLVSLADGALVLTTHRVRRTHTESGFSFVTSLMLEDVTSCEVSAESQPALLAAAAISVLAGLFLGALVREKLQIILAITAGLIMGASLVAAYFSGRRSTIEVKTPSGEATLNIKGIPSDAITTFMDALDSAKNERYLIVSRGIGEEPIGSQPAQPTGTHPWHQQ